VLSSEMTSAVPFLYQSAKVFLHSGLFRPCQIAGEGLVLQDNDAVGGRGRTV
jgi:hypothetical protein